MNDKSLEELSALIDGCLPKEAAQRLIDLSVRDTDVRAVWMRYHLIGDALRNNLPKNTNLDLARQISRILEQEPTVLARKGPSLRRMLLPIAGLAMAASVAMVAVVSLQKVDKNTSEPELKPITEQAPIINPLPVSTVRWDSQPSSPSPRLHRYLLNHNQYNSSLSMQGVSPYVRIVSYEGGQ